MNTKKIIYSVVSFSLLLTAGGLILAADPCPAGSVCIPNYGPTDFCVLLTNIATAVTGLVGGLATVMILVSGIMFLTSGGSQERMGQAKKTLLYAIIGLAIALSASAIVLLITTSIKATGIACKAPVK